MNVEKFSKDGQSVWEVVGKNGKTYYSVAIKTINNTLDLSSGNIRTEVAHVWMRSESEAVALEVQTQTINALKAGTIMPYRAFSETPFYDGQEQDINPETGLELGRYSAVKLCPTDQHATLHRQFVVLETATPPATGGQPKPKLGEVTIEDMIQALKDSEEYTPKQIKAMTDDVIRENFEKLPA